jgi:hypothetical protein
MSPENFDTLLEDILLAFSVEPSHDRATLERYLKRYPQYAGDLIDMSHELRLPGRDLQNAVEDEAVFQRAWQQFAKTVPGTEPSRPVTNPFDAFRGTAFAALAQKLRIPRSLLIAFRDRLVIASSIPGAFLARVARAARSNVADLMAHLELPAVVAPAANYKADQKPAAPAKVPFEELLDASGVTPDQKTDIYTSSE